MYFPRWLGKFLDGFVERKQKKEKSAEIALVASAARLFTDLSQLLGSLRFKIRNPCQSAVASTSIPNGTKVINQFAYNKLRLTRRDATARRGVERCGGCNSGSISTSSFSQPLSPASRSFERAELRSPLNTSVVLQFVESTFVVWRTSPYLFQPPRCSIVRLLVSEAFSTHYRAWYKLGGWVGEWMDGWKDGCSAARWIAGRSTAFRRVDHGAIEARMQS